MQQQELKIEYIPIDQIKPNEYNPKQMTPKEAEDLEKSIVEFGIVDPLICNKAKDRDGMIIGGHQRYKIYKKLKYEKVPVVWLEISDLKKEQELCLRLSKNTGEWDYDLLANFDEDLLKDVGWDDKDLEKIFGLDVGEEIGIDKEKKLKEIKILNLYAGIGGNRRFWGDLNITSVEWDEEIAKIYTHYFPKDKIIVTDAHEYLEEHFEEYDFIWSSPPCPTHSRMRKNLGVGAGRLKPKYPDLKLYEEILFLQGFHKGKWVIENVVSWYDPLIEPQKRGRHYYWSNFDIPEIGFPEMFTIGSIDKWQDMDLGKHAKKFGFDGFEKFPKIKGYSKDTILRNLIHPKEGEYILKCAYQD